MSARVANRRIRLLLAVFVLAFGVAFLRAAWLQGVRAASFGRLASSQHSEEVTIPAARGTLYDRGGVQLAIGEQATTVYADPRRVADPRSEAPIVAKSLRLDPNEVYSALTDRSRGFVYVARKADPTLAAKLARKGLPGLGFYHEERRFYPQFNLASQVLGYAGVDNRGLAGLELSLDQQLAGRPGRERIVKDASGQAIDTITSRTERDGEDVYLTLDHTIQANAQAVLRDTVRKWHAKSATAIVLDPATGAVRAMAVAPGFDANVYPKVWRVLQRNRAVTDTYEPGSTFKLVTVAGALSERLVSPRTRFTLPVRDSRRRPRHPRRRTARDGDDERRPDPLPLLQRGCDHACEAARSGPPGPLDLALRLRQADRDRLSRREPRDHAPGEELVGVVDRQHPDRAGHRGHGDPDGGRLRGDREPRRVGGASPRRPHRRWTLEGSDAAAGRLSVGFHAS